MAKNLIRRLFNDDWLLFGTVVAIGSLLVSLKSFYTIIFRWTHPDAIAQILGVQYWLHGFHEFFTVGATNYLIKTPFYMALSLVIGDNRYLLVGVGILFNVLFFIGFAFLVRWVLSIYSSSDKTSLKKLFTYSLVLWIGLISSSALILRYPNSRNIELLLGLFWMIFVIKLLRDAKKLNFKHYLILFAVSSITFFADPYQAYVIIAPVAILLVLLSWLRKKPNITYIGAASLTGIFTGKLLQMAVDKLTFIEFLPTPVAAQNLTTSSIIDSIKAVLDSYFAINGSAFYKEQVFSAAWLFMLFNLGVTVFLITLIAKRFRTYTLKNVLTKKDDLSWILLVPIISSILLMIISKVDLGQADLQRYLIVIPFLFVLFAATQEINRSKAYSILSIAIVIFVLLSFISTSAKIVAVWDKKFGANTPIFELNLILKEQNINKVLVEWGDAAPATFYSNRDITALPVRCDPNDKIVKSNFLMFERDASRINANKTALAFAANGTLLSCTTIDLVKTQFGEPTYIKTVRLSSGDYIILVYNDDVTERLVSGE